MVADRKETRVDWECRESVRMDTATESGMGCRRKAMASPLPPLLESAGVCAGWKLWVSVVRRCWECEGRVYHCQERARTVIAVVCVK